MSHRLNDTSDSARSSGLSSAVGVTRLLMVCLSIPAIMMGALVAAVFMPCAYLLGCRMRSVPRASGRPPRGGRRMSVGSALVSQQASRLLG